jgi:uncharacterized protein (TIGR02996 family)
VGYGGGMHYTDRSEWAAHLAGIIEQPADDVRRLVLCDWLEELGEDEAAARSEFIRVQCELAKYPNGYKVEVPPVSQGRNENTAADFRFVELLRRERELWAVLKRSFIRSEWLATRLRSRFDRSHGKAIVLVRRGFVAEMRCRLMDWCGGVCEQCGGRGGWENNRRMTWDTCPRCHGTGRTMGFGPAVVDAHPVERVTLTDKRPVQGRTDSWAWQFVDRPERHWELPRAFYANGTQHLFDSEEEATDAGSRLATAWAKSQPTHAVYHGDGRTYRIAPTGA